MPGASPERDTDARVAAGTALTDGSLPMNNTLWIVTPVYRDVTSFRTLRERLVEIIRSRNELSGLDVRFAVVDDTAGFDPEIDLLREMPDVILLEAPFNLGHQRAIVFGLRTLRPRMGETDLVVTLDADGEDRPEDLPRLLAPLLDGEADLRRVAAARRTKRTTTVRFKVAYFFFRILFRLLTGTTVRTGNYAAYRGWLVHRMITHPHFDLSYSSALLSLGVPIHMVPCERGRRYAGRSQMGFGRLFMHGLRMMMPFIDRIAIRALLLFSVTLAVGVAIGLAVLGIRVFTDVAIPGWAMYVLLAVLTLSMVALGNFITLFTVFSRSHGISLADLEERQDRSGPGPTSTDIPVEHAG